MKKGQTSIIAVFMVGLLALGIAILSPKAILFFASQQGDDPLLNFFLSGWTFLFIIIAAIISFVVWISVSRGQ